MKLILSIFEKFKVRNIIIAGFACTTAVLVLLGGFSAYQFGSVNDLTTRVNNLSIPALVHSSQLQVQFVKMGENALDDYYTQDLSELDGVEAKFKRNYQSFESASQKLDQVVANDPELKTALTTVQQTSEELVNHVNRLFTTHRNQLTLEQTIKNQRSELEELIEDTGSLSMDITDSEGIRKAGTDAAGLLEDYLGTLLEQVLDVSTVKKLDAVTTVNNEIEASVSAIKETAQKVKENSRGDALEFANELVEKINTISELANGTRSVVANKQASIEANAHAKKALTDSQADIDRGIGQLSNLFSLARELANDNQRVVDRTVAGAQNLTIFLFLPLAIIIAVLVAFVAVASITKPLSEVNRMLNIVASGDLTQHLNDDADNEFGELAKNCNSLINSLRTLIEGIISRSTQLAAASEETSNITTETTQAIQDQRTQMEQAATATTEMSSTSQSVMHSAEEALHEIKHADSEAQRVKEISLQNKQTIVQLAQEVEEAAQVINKLHSDSASIGSILDVIRGIADQTNLLALNAAIEAARAGEQGRGFAVVADEVRSLASKTQDSTQEIQAMIQVLQSGAEAAVEVMDRGKSQADSCVSQSEVADQALNSITSAVHQTHDASEQISTAAQEQHAVSQEISERLESIVSIAEQTALGADQTAISSHEVARLSEELRQSVVEFKV